MMSKRLWQAVNLLLAAGGFLLLPASAHAGSGQPSPKQFTFQEAVTPIAEEIHWVHDFVNVIIFLITIFVMLLLL
jgi:cytochrome c oxidase subunit 2